jgi:hypothetical protein
MQAVVETESPAATVSPGPTAGQVGVEALMHGLTLDKNTAAQQYEGARLLLDALHEVRLLDLLSPSGVRPIME